MGRSLTAIAITISVLFTMLMFIMVNEASSDPFPPTVSPPTSFEAIPGQTSITLNWGQPDVGYLTATGFSIYRSIDDIDYSLLEIVDKDIFSYEDDAVIVGRTFFYYLRTNSDLGQSINSEKISSAADDEPPDVEIVSPVQNEYLGIVDVDVRLQLGDELSQIISVTYQLNDDHPIEIGEVDTIRLTDLVDGEYILFVNAQDNAGNNGSASRTFTVDTSDPILTIISPYENELLSSSDVVIEWDSSDATSYILQTELSLDSGQFEEVSNHGTHSLSYLRSDEYTIRLRVRDPAGNSITAWRNFTVDGDSPSVVILEDDEYAITNETSYRIDWEGNDPTTDYYFESRFDSDPWEIESRARSKLLTGLGEGAHWFQVRITDGVGNTAEDGVEIVVDQSPPSFKWVFAKVSEKGTVPIILHVRDEFSFIDSIFYSVDGGEEIVVFRSVSKELVFDDDNPILIEDLPPGDVDILIGAIDGAGNRVVETVRTYVDLDPPEIIETIPNGTVSIRPDMIEVRFDEVVDPLTVQVSGIGDDGYFEVKSRIVEIFPEFPFEFGRTYSFRIGARDRSGNVMTPQDIEIRITDMVELTGWVLDENGKGLRDALVTLHNGRYTMTNDDGSYSLETKMGNITVYASKEGFKTRSTDMVARPDRDNSVRVIKLEKDEGTLISRITSFFDDPVNLIFLGLGFLILMFLSFIFFRYRDRLKITEVDIEMDEEISEDTFQEDLDSH